MINKSRWDDSADYREGYMAGEDERVALAMANDRMRNELIILTKLYRQLEKSGD